MDIKNTIKISFTGDILCYETQNKVSQISEDNYNYDAVFDNIKNILNNSDYLIGSLETPLAGKEMGYTNSSKNFNTPKQFAQSLKKYGFDLLTTGNNHCLDRGIIGLIKTIECLNEYGIDHTGTYVTKAESETIFVKDIDSVKIAFLSYTYGTNSRSNKNILKGDEIYLVDLFRAQDKPIKKELLIKRILKKIYRTFINPFYKKPDNTKVSGRLSPIIDNVNPKEISNPANNFYINRLLKKINIAKKQADLVVLCMHAGGQFNFYEGPGEYTKHLTKLAFENGVNFIIGNHTHCVLPSQFLNNKTFGAYSLGNFCFTPGDGYYIDGVYADYSILLNLHIDKTTKEIAQIYFSILKSIKDNSGYSKVFNVTDLYNNETIFEKKSELKKDVNTIISKFLNKNFNSIEVLKEYNYLDLIKS